MRPALEHDNVDADDRRRGPPARHRRERPDRHAAWSSTATVRSRSSPATWSSCRAARPTAPSCCWRRPTRGIRDGLANGSDQVGRNYMFHNSQAVLALSKEPNPTVFQKTLGLNDFYFGGPGFEFPLGNIQMVGKSSRRDVPRREAAPDPARARADARGGRPARRRLLALDRGPAGPGEPRHPDLRRQGPARATRPPTGSRRSGCCTSSSRCSAAIGMQQRPPDPPPRLPEERHPRRGRARTRPAPAASAPIRRPRS